MNKRKKGEVELRAHSLREWPYYLEKKNCAPIFFENGLTTILRRILSFGLVICLTLTLFTACEKVKQLAGGAPKKIQEVSEEDIDYWKDVDFTYADFQHVIKIIDKNYIDPSYDPNTAYVFAAHYALLSLEKPRELVTLKFYNQNKDLPDERNRLAGKVMQLSPKDKFYIHFFDEGAKEQEKDKFEGKKLSDEEILKEVNKEKDRMRRWIQSWSDIPFGKEGFERIMKYVELEAGKEDPKFDIKKVYLAASQGYLRSLDPHSMLISSKEWDESTKKIQDSSFEGIGALLRPEGDYTMVETPLDENQPSFRAGLKPGDLIIKVDGQDIKSMKIHKVVQLIKGPKGTPVVLTIRRKGTPEDFDVKIIRDFINIQNVQSKLIPELPGVGYIKVTGFVDTTLKDLLTHTQKLMQEAQDNKLTGLILDLRNNAGGKLDQAIQMADVFLQQNSPIVSVKYAKGASRKSQEAFLAQLPSLVNVPMAVLINARSASASEIVASAIQDNHRGFIVGERSYGKGSVQNLVPNRKFSPSYYVKLTIGRFYGPKGNTIQVTGITPDFPVTEDPEKDYVFHFREENMEGHLTMIPSHTLLRSEVLITKTQSCIAQSGSAQKTIADNPNPSIKHDIQLLSAIDMLRCQLSGAIRVANNTGKS